ncbi:MAG: thioredoxin-like domain-containing protein [Aggregatilineales bacterium]
MRRLILAAATLALAGAVLATVAQDSEGGTVRNQYEGRIPAPEFPGGLDWLNVPAPLTLADLRGKIVLLDFWTYGCINCIHMIPVLAQLEEKYGDALAVIGVHSAKFDNEGRTDNIRQIVQRYGLEHPVVNDSGFDVWRTFGSFGVNAWPTFVLIDPRGQVLAVQAGEVPFEAFDRVIGGMVEHWDSLGELDRTPLRLALERDQRPNTLLAFPGKVLADAATNRLFIADTGHHRIVIADLLTYEVLDVIGDGAAGLADGAFEAARFNQPQGMALVGSTLYIADTKNHAIRSADLAARTVRTAAGTGEKAAWGAVGGRAEASAIASPWDLAFDGSGLLHIAMAGPHQLWTLDLNAGVVYPLVGSGREGLVDGALAESQLAQPSGLYFRDGALYFADSESSSIRAADLTNGRVFTLAGPTAETVPNPAQRLFAFGDVDGPVGQSRLQHPLAVTGGADGYLYVADTYNSKIKRIDPATRQIVTLYGVDGETGGFRDGGPDEAAFDEPGGLAYADGRLYVADTNNHAIRVIDLAAQQVTTVVFPNPEALQIGERPTVVAGNSALGAQVALPEQTAAPGDGEIVLDIVLPQGYKLNALAPFSADWATSGAAVIIAEADQRQRLSDPALPLRVPARLLPGSDLLRVDLTIYYCEAVNESLCFVEQVSIDAPVTVTANGGQPLVSLTHTIVPPELPTAGGL